MWHVRDWLLRSPQVAPQRPASTAKYLTPALGFCVVLGLLFFVHGAADISPATVRDFDASPSCRKDRLATDPADPPRAAPSRGECVIQTIVVTARERAPVGKGGGAPSYWVTVRLPWGTQRQFQVAADGVPYKSINVGARLNALLYERRVAYLVIYGRAISTTDNPDAAYQREILILAPLLLIAGLALFSLYRRSKRAL